MDCHSITFSGHAVQRMFERNLSKNDIIAVIQQAEIIVNYPQDQPYPSCLLLGFINQQALHIALARDSMQNCYVVTAYLPNPSVWHSDFKTRKN